MSVKKEFFKIPITEGASIPNILLIVLLWFVMFLMITRNCDKKYK